jgi:hypothetical protein
MEEIILIRSQNKTTKKRSEEEEMVLLLTILLFISSSIHSDFVTEEAFKEKMRLFQDTLHADIEKLIEDSQNKTQKTIDDLEERIQKKIDDFETKIQKKIDDNTEIVRQIKIQDIDDYNTLNDKIREWAVNIVTVLSEDDPKLSYKEKKSQTAIESVIKKLKDYKKKVNQSIDEKISDYDSKTNIHSVSVISTPPSPSSLPPSSLPSSPSPSPSLQSPSSLPPNDLSEQIRQKIELWIGATFEILTADKEPDNERNKRLFKKVTPKLLAYNKAQSSEMDAKIKTMTDLAVERIKEVEKNKLNVDEFITHKVQEEGNIRDLGLRINSMKGSGVKNEKLRIQTPPDNRNRRQFSHSNVDQ